MKKIIAFIFCIAIMSITAYAQEEVKNVVLDSAMMESENIIYNQKEGSESEHEKFAKEKDVYVKKGIDTNLQNPVIAMDGKYQNAVISMETEFDFTDAAGEKASYDGFMLRAQESGRVCWSNNECYVIIIREDSVEIQVFSPKGSGFLLNQKAEIPKNEKCNVTLGTIDTEKGVYVFIKVNDKVYGAYDEKNTIMREGYFNLEFRGGIKVYPIEKAEVGYIPAVTLAYDVKDSSVVTDVTDVFGEKKDLTYTWYLSKEDKVPSNSGMNDMADIFEVVEGETKDSFLLMGQDIGKYVYCEVTDGTTTSASDIVYISPVEYTLVNDFLAVVGYNTFIKDGEKFVFDKENADVYADEKDGLCYLPIRGIADSYGWPVNWNGEEQIVELMITSKDFYDTKFKIGHGDFIIVKQLMSGVMMAGVPYISEGRTYLDAVAVQELIGDKFNLYDEQSGLLVISDKKLNYSDNDLIKLVDAVTFTEE